MNFLLKIVEGPMNGAEIALVEGLRVRVGSGADCDIVLADAALSETAFELDVSAESVSLIRGEDVKTLVPFEVFESGTSAFVIGPAEGVWEPLKREVKGKGEGEQGNGSPSPVDAASSPRQSTTVDAESSPRQSTVDAESSPRPNKDDLSTSDAEGIPRLQMPRRRGLLACCCALIVLLLVAAAVWFFWPTIADSCPQVANCCKQTSVSAVTASAPTLADLARQYNLVLTNVEFSAAGTTRSPGRCPVLRGNFVRRTERMAVRALALADDPTVKLELTDDESLSAAASELLFVVTEDALTVASATNGVVTLAGFAPSAASLERTIRALNDDVPGLRDVHTAAVRVGGLPPPKRDEPKQVFDEVPQLASDVKPAGEAASRRVKKSSTPRIYPIAGILTTPYKTVVLENGLRVTEGGTINNAVVERIEPDRIVFRSGSTTLEWKP